MSDKHCNCGGCSNCCDGYVQDAENPNRYVNLKTGQERKIKKKKPKVNLLLIWLFIALFFTYYSNLPPVKTDQPQKNQSR